MNASWSHHYDVIKKISSLSGQWPYQRPIMRLFCVILVTLSTISMIIPQMKILIDQLFIDWNELETPEEYEIMKKYAKNGRRYSLGYLLYCYFAVYVFMSVSLIPQILDIVLPLNESRPILPTYPGYYFVDERKYFFYIFSHAIIAWEIAMTGIVTHDCMLLTYIEHVCSIFALVGHILETLSVVREEHRRIPKGTSSARTQEDDVTMEGLTTIKHESRKDRERDCETRSSRDWSASEHDAKKLQKGVIAQPKRDWRRTFSIGKVTDSGECNSGVCLAVTFEIRKLER
ncbi:PREDICTED: uncharacterized protein LOC105143257 [Acromyrmex echinatior]|nr:PREDICTED: uncharacterized protein LOC105143257 [Acromyrmex echinatior]